MRLESAKKYIDDTHPDMDTTAKQNVHVALDSLSPIIEAFEPQHIEKIYQLEQINPFYFPGLSKAAAVTILNLRQANPRLPLDFILDTVRDLATRGRPWESLRAFSAFGRHCRAQMNQENLSYLVKVNSDIIEIVGGEINNKMSAKEKTVLGQLHKKFSFFHGSTHMQCDKRLRESVDECFSRFYSRSGLRR